MKSQMKSPSRGPDQGFQRLVRQCLAEARMKEPSPPDDEIDDLVRGVNDT